MHNMRTVFLFVFMFFTLNAQTDTSDTTCSDTVIKLSYNYLDTFKRNICCDSESVCVKLVNKIKLLRSSTKCSYYAHFFHGRKTASGKKYNMHAMTCAHPFLPFGTRLRITNLRNEKSVIVVVNDRGPYDMHKGGKVKMPLRAHQTRYLDLSLAAFKKIGSTSTGVLTIKVEQLIL